ncbi:LysM peptidoglycan-binding domain-containing protein [Larkinella insperata]|uniref:LysM peptidoglycan-binding domain-containing protein n=1 Tax=Larkinella insperata TaxID=332158 RepID=A0ABW3QFR2_9BACT|nr:LysM peptidoglycan-binding domain-containing protein [Larkinella insperata]
MKRLLPLLLAGCLTSMVAQAHPILPDSLGMEKKEGKLYVLHRVEQGQTLFSLVRKYKTTLQAIKEANPGLPDNVRYNQVVRVPASNLSRKQEKAVTKAIKKEEKEQQREEREVKTETAKEANSGIHQVEPGQTLYSLATRYGVSMDAVRRWNNLPSDNIVSGQALIVSEKAWRVREPLAKPATPHRTEPAAEAARTSRNDSPKTERPAPPRTLPPAPREEAPRPTEAERTPAEPTSSEPAEPRIIRPGDSGPLPNPGGNARRMSEIGMAEVIDQSGNSNKYLALHRTAPIGTLVLVRNDMNQQSIWVKVIGRLPDTSVNEKVIVKISARAFEKLSPVDRRFRAEVSYLVP